MKVPVSTSITVSCEAKLGMTDHRFPMAFTPDVDCLPEGISIPDSVVLVKSGAKHHIIDKTSHNIKLNKNTYLGNVERMKSITSLQVKKVFFINNHQSVKLEIINNTKSAEDVTPMEEI